MPSIDLIKRAPVSKSGRAQQLEALFDVPRRTESVSEWHGDVPYEDEPWNIGLIVGSSGSGKTSIAHELFGRDRVSRQFKWDAQSVIDDIAPDMPIDKVVAACQAVGFNTIPAWLRSYSVLSTGEQFRVGIARSLLEHDDPIVIDEFTSVVDRQVAKVASHAVQRFVRSENRKLVAVSCHYDVIDWLQPDWVFEPATMTLTRRSLQPRPRFDVEISSVDYSTWGLFAPFHYMTASLNRAARCFCLFVDGQPVAFTSILHRPHPTAKNIKGVSRSVTLPDWQGLGLMFVLNGRVAAAYNRLGYRVHNYPAHPSYVRSMDRSSEWAMVKRPGIFSSTKTGPRSSIGPGGFGGRPNATFAWVGGSGDWTADDAIALTGAKNVAMEA